MTHIPAGLRGEIVRFFDEFVAAFAHFDGRLIAQRYQAPYSALHAGGQVDLLASTDEIGQYFQRVVDGYRADGCEACRHRDLLLVPVGAESAFASVTWDLLRTDGTVMVSWRESYNLTRVQSGWRIVASMDHVDGDVA